MPSRIELGSVFRGYRVDAVLGQGGMGAVYLATHVRLQRRAALKVLLPELAADEGFRERFIRESQLAASLEHPNIVPVYDADEEQGVLYLAMRFIEGEDLRSFMDRKGRLSPELTLTVIEQAASALDVAHASGLVHRDVKPANILLGDSGTRVYLTDFGVAKRIATPGLTRTGSFIGTVDYCAPEQIEGKDVDARTDVYALGCVLFHCLAGQPPYKRDSEVAVIHAHLLEPPPAISSLRPDLPAATDAVIETAMAKQRDLRYQTCGALVEGLRAALTGSQPAPAATVPAALPATEVAPPSPPVEPPPPPPTPTEPPAAADEGPPTPVPSPVPATPVTRARGRRLPRRRLLIVGALVLLGIAGAAVAAVLALGGGSKRPKPPPVPITNIPAAKRADLALVGGSLYLTHPSGRLARLDPVSLKPESSLADPAHPRAVVGAGNEILTADDRTLTTYRARDFVPVAAVNFGTGPVLAAAANAPAAAARGTDTGGGRVCVVRQAKPAQCFELGFAPSGLGVAPAGVFVADEQSGTVLPLTARRGALVPGRPLTVGAGPVGRMLEYGGDLYVPVARGVAVVHLASGRLRRTISLGTRPSAVWVVPSTGRLFASLPGTGEVAVVDVRTPGAQPQRIQVGNQPAALGGGRLPGGREAVFVIKVGDGSIARLDPLTGRVLSSKRVAALRGKPPDTLAVRGVSIKDAGRTVTATIQLAGGTLQAAGLRPRDTGIRRGSALFGLWQGGISTRLTEKKGAGLSVGVKPAPGRLLLSVTAKRGAFTGVKTRLGSGGRSVVLVLAKAPTPASRRTRRGAALPRSTAFRSSPATRCCSPGGRRSAAPA